MELAGVGIDLGGTSVKMGVVTPEGEVLARKEVATPKGPARPAVAELSRVVLQLIQDSGLRPERIGSVGVGTPGILDSKKGLVRTASNLEGWVDVPLGDWLANDLGRPVRVINDAHAAALGEIRFGTAKGIEDLVLLTLGTGVGGAVVVGGRVVEGSRGLAGNWAICASK